VGIKLKNRTNHSFALFFSVSCLLILLSSSVFGAIIGVSPSVVRFNKMIKEGYAEVKITITTSTELPIKAHFTREGEIQDWISFTPQGEIFNFSKSKPYEFMLIIQPPADAKSGNYTGSLKMTTDELATVDSGAGSSIIAQIELPLYIEVIGDEIVQCKAGAISAYNTETGKPFNVKATVENDGNVRLRSEVKVDVWDQYQTQIIFSNTFYGDQILPTRSKDILKEINNELPVGQYFADIYLKDCDVSSRITFDVVEKGQISDAGQFIGIRTNDIAYSKEPMPIIPMFQNNGIRKVVAQFKGEVINLKTNKIARVLESDSLEVNPGETMEFNMFFIPEEAGEYQISGRIVYNNKITFNEASKVVKVLNPDKKSKISGALYLILYFIILLVILIMIARIRRAKKKGRK
jgi:hypothetical protein